ncbi:F-box/kelch-repeat protein At3g06240-like [Silene latifolia]|uniref:F-box/kelch-repeat protein At3g06240-like n=1 Tax=Silene latifolia TaxID=37657 RepID=UPI003D78A74B
MVLPTYFPFNSVCGFGFDPISDDYKVVRLIELDICYEASSEVQVEVFSLKSGCWRVIGVGPCFGIKPYYNGYTPRFFNGSVYWVVSSYSPDEYVLRFDMSTEIFETIQLPEVLKLSESGYIQGLYIQASERMLTLIKSNYSDYESRICSTCSAWILKEDGVGKSWTKIFDFDIAKLRPRGMPMAFSFRKNGEIIMVKSNHQSYVEEENVVFSIDPVTQSEATLRNVNAKHHSFYLSTYVESMVLFKEGKGIEEQNTPLKFFPIEKRFRFRRGTCRT